MQNQRHEVHQKEDAERMDTRENLRTFKESTVKEEESTHTTDIKHSALWRPPERRARQRNPYTCLACRTMASGSEKRLTTTAVLLSV